ncbi:LysR family transcriptional regulator [Vibrio vulnificus]|uniref:LysR family transcriptional regulator n=1 Tax=Vibrio vulnificus TaxID=672 RepID=UPI001022F0F7|nr:LysR family transcriptional regulator [Vibrio vulnificus]RZP63510.1 LysR family transcriptional regulator [Vibrio vulnificus]RZR13291.1 LysR family transcriptional regulator [Vibrio vulnificus]HAS6169214.1 LysR family transcriptional regulator [Vibrio vulnificus]
MLLEGIETLLVLHKEKTMSRTGSQLYISQSAVSKRIANLEKKLGKKLIEPDGRHIRLTADAQALIKSIEPSFNELRGQIYDQQLIEDNALIKIDCSETLLAGYLNNAMEALYLQDRHLSLTTNHTPRIVEHVQSGKATLGFCAGYLPPNHGLMTFHLFDESFSIISKYPLIELPKAIITNDLNNPANTYQLAALSAVGVTPLMQMDSYTASAQLAVGGMAPALVPKSVINALRIEPQYCYHFDELSHLTRPVTICCRAKSHQNSRVKTVITTIADAVAKVV